MTTTSSSGGQPARPKDALDQHESAILIQVLRVAIQMLEKGPHPKTDLQSILSAHAPAARPPPVLPPPAPPPPPPPPPKDNFRNLQTWTSTIVRNLQDRLIKYEEKASGIEARVIEQGAQVEQLGSQMAQVEQLGSQMAQVEQLGSQMAQVEQLGSQMAESRYLLENYGRRVEELASNRVTPAPSPEGSARWKWIALAAGIVITGWLAISGASEAKDALNEARTKLESQLTNNSENNSEAVKSLRDDLTRKIESTPQIATELVDVVASQSGAQACIGIHKVCVGAAKILGTKKYDVASCGYVHPADSPTTIRAICLPVEP